MAIPRSLAHAAVPLAAGLTLLAGTWAGAPSAFAQSEPPGPKSAVFERADAPADKAPAARAPVSAEPVFGKFISAAADESTQGVTASGNEAGAAAEQPGAGGPGRATPPAGSAASVGSAPAPSGAPVIRILEGAPSPDISVSVNRAVVLEAASAFAEVSVANPGIADVAALSNRSVYILGKQAGRTTLTLLGPGGQLMTNISVRVGPDLAEFKQRLQDILPDERIQVRSAADGIVLSGTVSSSQKLGRAVELAERYAPGRVSNMMTVGGSQQVLLRVRFAEVQRNASKALGFNWTFGVGTGNWGFEGNTGGYLAGGSPGEPTDNGLSGSFPAGDSTEGVLRLGYSAGGVIANLAIDALEAKGVARTLAEPNLVALSGDNASFLAGGEFPVPVFGESGEIAVEYKPFGVSLSFTPTVVNKDVINLEMEAESSSIDNSRTFTNAGLDFTGFSTRRTSTTIELRDGQSFAIAGLLQDEFIDNANQLPWISDVPVLGTLFRS
ncbi:MAG: pilus assembly protein N-terminal domain-containing protein, partial [Pseudomonadota bacterium]